MALDERHSGFSKEIKTDTKAALAETTLKDAPYLFWAAAGWAGAIAADKNNMDTMAELPITEAMMRRVLELDPNFKDGAVHEFFIAYEGGRPEASGGNIAAAKEHFRKAVECSKGEKAFPYVIYAETVAVKQQNLALFNHLLDKALAIDTNKVKKLRLVNTIAQERAIWLKSRIPELFVDYQEEE